MKVFFLIIITFFTFNANAEYKKVEAIIDGNKLSYMESQKNYLIDSVFNMKEEQDTEILYFFSYNCSSCYAFKDYFRQAEDIINKKDNIRLEKIPLFIEENSINYYNAQLFFWRKILGFNRDFDSIIFDLIHKENISIQSEKDIKRLLTNYALTEEKDLKSNIKNVKLNYRMQMSNQIAKDLNVTTTPSIVIHKNGKRYIINATDAGTPFNMLLAIIYIIDYK